ncbi:MAG TPA: hypothetical protein VF857_03890 [Spirochaetota bacterium]
MNEITRHLGTLKKDGLLNAVVATVALPHSFPLGIGLLKDASLSLDMPFFCMIGGCESMRDMYDARSFGVDGLTAPMIDSAYALEKFIEASDAVFSPEELSALSRGIEFSSIESVENSARILDCGMSQYINEVWFDLDGLSSPVKGLSGTAAKTILSSIRTVQEKGIIPAVSFSIWHESFVEIVGDPSVEKLYYGIVSVMITGQAQSVVEIIKKSDQACRAYQNLCGMEGPASGCRGGK